MNVESCQHTQAEEILVCLARLTPRTVIIDVEPLVAHWNGDTAALDDGVSRWAALISTLPSVESVVFATNSQRRPSAVPTHPGLAVDYRSTSLKPFRAGPFRRLPLPGVLIGDQLATDGLLAWRLGYTFIHYRPQRGRASIGVHLMRAPRPISPAVPPPQRTSASFQPALYLR